VLAFRALRVKASPEVASFDQTVNAGSHFSPAHSRIEVASEAPLFTCPRCRCSFRIRGRTAPH